MLSFFKRIRGEILETDGSLLRLKTVRPLSPRPQHCTLVMGREQWKAQVVPYRRVDDGTTWVKVCSPKALLEDLRVALRRENSEGGSTTASERRGEQRFRAALAVWSPDLPGFRAQTVDVSEKGLRILACSGIPEGRRLRLQVSYDKTPEQPITVMVTGVTVWSSPNKEGGQVQLGVRLGDSQENSAL